MNDKRKIEYSKFTGTVMSFKHLGSSIGSNSPMDLAFHVLAVMAQYGDEFSSDSSGIRGHISGETFILYEATKELKIGVEIVIKNLRGFFDELAQKQCHKSISILVDLICRFEDFRNQLSLCINAERLMADYPDPEIRTTILNDPVPRLCREHYKEIQGLFSKMEIAIELEDITRKPIADRISQQEAIDLLMNSLGGTSERHRKWLQRAHKKKSIRTEGEKNSRVFSKSEILEYARSKSRSKDDSSGDDFHVGEV